MIVIVDDDHLVLDMFEEILTEMDFQVLSFSSAHEALRRLREEKEPDIILSDVVMPEMDGYDFQKSYFQTFPYRKTPFIYLSAVTDPDKIAAGIELGATDFLSKSIEPQILKAKIRSYLKLRSQFSPQVFTGKLKDINFYKILHFCEKQGFTGTLTIRHLDSEVSIESAAGKIADPEIDEKIEKILDFPDGDFILLSQPMQFDTLLLNSDFLNIDKQIEPQTCMENKKPAGKLSGVKVNERYFQIQTEVCDSPQLHILTVVVYDGKVIKRKKKQVKPELTFHELEELVTQQHLLVESELKEKISQRLTEKSEQQLIENGDFNGIVERGHSRYLEKDYLGALELWEKALTIKPDDSMLKINITVIKKKIESLNK